jgi:hypothetical protein
MKNDQVTQVQKLVSDFVIDQITQMVEDMSSNDFIEQVMDRIEQEGIELDFDNEDTFEEVKDIVGERVIPLLFKMTEFIVEEQEQD